LRATSIVWPAFFKTAVATEIFASLSSANNKCSFKTELSTITCLSADNCFCCTLSLILFSIAKGSVNQNKLPLPNSLSTPKSPFNKRINLLQIANPRPVPSKRLLDLFSTWENASNRVFWSSYLIPIPVSFISNRKFTYWAVFSSNKTEIKTSPFLLNLTALFKKFNITCLILLTSETNISGISGFI